MISIDRQILRVQRELKKLPRVYERQIHAKRMTSAEATRDIEEMRAVLQTLRFVQAGQRVRETGK